MTELPQELRELVAPMLQKRLYAVFSTMATSMDALKPHLLDHLRYLIALEQRGILFASGPYFDEQGQLEGNSLTLLRADSLAQAEAIVAEDPLHVNGIRRYQIKGWQINEGSFSVTLHYSNGGYTIG